MLLNLQLGIQFWTWYPPDPGLGPKIRTRFDQFQFQIFNTHWVRVRVWVRDYEILPGTRLSSPLVIVADYGAAVNTNYKCF